LSDHYCANLLSKYSFLKSSQQFIDVHAKYEAGLPAEVNRPEAQYITALLCLLIRHKNIAYQSITILTPYQKQRAFIESMLQREFTDSAPQVCTVDEYQGENNRLPCKDFIKLKIFGFCRKRK
jgi:superfamily I DNA and/or RNA helicase